MWGTSRQFVVLMVLLSTVVAPPSAVAQGSGHVDDPPGDAARLNGEQQDWPDVDLLSVDVDWNDNSALLSFTVVGYPDFADRALWHLETATSSFIVQDNLANGRGVGSPCDPDTVSRSTSGHTRHLLFLDPDCLFHGSTWARLTLEVRDDATNASGQVTHVVKDEAAPVTIGTVPEEIPTNVPVVRYAGADRLQTATTIAGVFDPEDVDVVLLARADGYADALAAAPLATALGAPILLTGPEENYEVQRAIDRLRPSRLIVVGGTGAVSDQVVDAYTQSRDYAAERIAGPDRWATAHLIAEQLEVVRGTPHSGAVVVEGANADPSRGWPDAVAASAFAAQRGWPIVPVLHDRLPEASADTLSSLSEGAGVFVIGGTAAVSDDVETRVRDTVPEGATVTRLAGANRYATSAAIADLDPYATELWIATGASFPDALTAGAAAGHRAGVLVLTPPDSFSYGRGWVDRHGCGSLSAFRLAGGLSALSQQVEDEVRRRAGEPDCG